MPGYGLSEWGVGPWGILPATGTFELEGVFATSERTVRVTFTDPALVGTALKPGAAMNLASWGLSIVGSSESLILVAVREIEGSAARQFELYTLRKFPRYPAQLTLTAANVLSAAGGPLVGVPSATFDGAAQPPVTPRANASDVADFRAAQLPGASYAATLVTTAGGDYAVETGEALLRKMIYRRLVTSPGAFTFIPRADFGLGLRSKLSLRGLASLNTLKDQVEREVKREPDVADAVAQVSYAPALGIVSLTLKVRRASTGQDTEVGYQLPVDTGVTL